MTLRLPAVAAVILLAAPGLPQTGSTRQAWGQTYLKQEASWYSSPEARAVASSVILYQSAEGGWPKSTDLARPPRSPKDVPKAGDGRANTLDNDATTLPLQFLARIAHATGEEAFRASFLRGLDYLVASQYPSGGFPQFYPLRGNEYYSRITYNDGAMIRALNVLRDVASGQAPYSFVDKDRRAKAADAVKRGLDCILKTQIIEGGNRTVWCAQHDEKTLAPAWARAYEPPSFSGQESVGIVSFLMAVENPSPEIVSAIEGAVAWLGSVAMTGGRVDRITGADGRVERRLVSDPAAPRLWARFYELGTRRPLYLDRDSVFRYNYAEIGYERRSGYEYHGTWAEGLLTRDYPAWRARTTSQPKAPHFVLVGDSTVTDRSGWGLGFRQFVGDGVVVTNMAQNGRSSKSYRDEGHWSRALAVKGNYYLIQFGHNDQPGKGPTRETDPATTYTENLERYVDETRAQGATPVLVTSLVRRIFSTSDPTRIASTLSPYVDAVKALAARKKVPIIDLHASSLALSESMGPAETAKLDPRDASGKPDTTHLWAEGSAVFARLVVEGLREAIPALGSHLLTGPRSTRLVDLDYGEAGGEKLKLDASVPSGKGPFPIAIVVHGGGWTGGDKQGDISPVLTALTRANFAWFSINYRLAPQHRWPAPLEDVLASIRWVKAHGAELNGDPTRIALIGYSAGGQLATLSATVVDDSTRLQAVIGLAPLTDFVQELPKRGNILGRAQTGLLNRPQELTPESIGMLAALSPINHVRPGLPPILLLHGDKDASVPFEQSTAFQSKLRANGVRSDLITLPGAPHTLALWEKSMPDYQDRMITWLMDVLGAGR